MLIRIRCRNNRWGRQHAIESGQQNFDKKSQGVLYGQKTKPQHLICGSVLNYR